MTVLRNSYPLLAQLVDERDVDGDALVLQRIV